MLIDPLLHHSFKRDFDSLFKARVLVGIILVYFIILTGVIFWLQTTAPVTATGRTLGTVICIIMQISYISALWLMRTLGWYRIIAHFVVLVSVIGIIGGISISGGPLSAPATPMNVIPIIMAFVLLNKRSGFVWTQIVMLCHMGMIVATAYGVVFPQLLEPGVLLVQHMSHWLVTYTAMIGLMAVFLTLNSHLKAERDAERLKFQHLASHDPLTGLANRMQFNHSLKQSMNRSNRHHKMTALFFIDLDNFKPINDNLGHDAGDTVLREISLRLTDNVREMDTVARLGGDEFGIILEDISHENSLEQIADKLLLVICEPISQLTGQPSISASMGIALYPLHTQDKIELVKFADLAMYASKFEKNRWALFHPAMLEEDDL